MTETRTASPDEGAGGDMKTQVGPKENMIRCRFCGWSCRRWYTRQDGKKRNGIHRLIDHIAEFHPDMSIEGIMKERA